MHVANFHLEQFGVLWPVLAFACIFMLALLQCAGDRTSSSRTDFDWNQTTRIVYIYGDSSLPPQYHRSYRIDVTPVQARVTVDSYGTILAERNYTITRTEFDGLLNSLSKNDIRKVPQRDDEGCTGGASETISIYNEQNPTFSGQVYHCGGEDSGDLGGNIQGFADHLRNLIPDLPDLLK